MADLTGIGALADLANGIIGRIWPDATESDKQKMTMALAELDAQKTLLQGQLSTNAVEAANPSLFVSGWRPAVGWICVLILLYQYIIYPLLLWIIVFYPSLSPPTPVVSEVIWQLLFGLLGLAGLRTAEKVKGVARK